MQIRPDVQARSHAPQWVALSIRFTQLDPHNVVPAPQTLPQRPDEHTSPLAQTLPHVPQFDPSEPRSMQPLAQRVRPAMHRQEPETHVSPARQTGRHSPDPPAPPAPEAPPPPGREVCPQLAAITPRKPPTSSCRHARLGRELFCIRQVLSGSVK
jgi:hypothetical protein